MEEWLADKVKTKPKSANESAKYRSEGNKAYCEKNDEEALKIYNLSVSAAPYESTEFALALANRSAVLMRLKYYEVKLLFGLLWFLSLQTAYCIV